MTCVQLLNSCSYHITSKKKNKKNKNSILLKCDLLAVKTGSLYLDLNQGRQIAGLNALPLSYRVSQILTSYVRF